jgi:transcriptional regulator with XRE-family HTH domain
MVLVTKGLLGQRIRKARKARLKGMNLEVFGREIARAMGRGRAFSNVTISNWETGRQEPSWEALVGIVKTTCLPLEYFAGVGKVEDYPEVGRLQGRGPEFGPELQALISAVQQLDRKSQELVIRQLECLVETLGAGDNPTAGRNRGMGA